MSVEETASTDLVINSQRLLILLLQYVGEKNDDLTVSSVYGSCKTAIQRVISPFFFVKKDEQMLDNTSVLWLRFITASSVYSKIVRYIFCEKPIKHPNKKKREGIASFKAGAVITGLTFGPYMSDSHVGNCSCSI